MRSLLEEIGFGIGIRARGLLRRKGLLGLGVRPY